MNILFIVPYPTEGPSNRFRVEQYLPFLKKEGIEYRVRPFFSSRFYKILYKRGFLIKKSIFFIISFLRRMLDIISACRYDIVFIHREVFPFGSFMESFLRLFSKKIIYDFDDAIFLPNVSDSNRLIEAFKDVTKTEKIIRSSSHVIAGNIFLKNYAARSNKNVSVLPTPIDTDIYIPNSDRRYGTSVTMGWIGSVTTLKYLDIIADVFADILTKYVDVKLSVIGGTWRGVNSTKVICKDWQLDSEIRDLQSFDIGIMPLKNDAWAKGKCAFKIIEYMSVGIPVVASAVGMNNEVIQDGINGFLATGESDWQRKLSLLIENPDLRLAMGMAGRKAVEEKYSLKVNAPKLISILKE